MTKQEIKFLEDLRAFLDWAIVNHKAMKLSFWTVLATLAHDARGLFDYKTDKFFSPRTSGYAKKVEVQNA